MFRTRDFILLFTTITFLVAAIGVTSWLQWQDQQRVTVVSGDPTLVLASSSDLLLTADVPGDTTAERAARLAAMRAAVEVTLPETLAEAAVVPVEPEPIPVTATTSDDAALDSPGAITCPEFAEYRGFWDPRGLTVEVREGALVVERMLETGPQMIVQLPVRTVPEANPHCLPSEVVGIAMDGSLIRNDELALYGVFGPDTRIGYALDGLPIHGVGLTRGDLCGGRVVNGQYRYELSVTRAELLTCFAAKPTSLP